jgi:hypothetical protein
MATTSTTQGRWNGTRPTHGGTIVGEKRSAEDLGDGRATTPPSPARVDLSATDTTQSVDLSTKTAGELCGDHAYERMGRRLRMPHVIEEPEPIQASKLKKWIKAVSSKHNNGNCLFRSIGEGLGICTGYDNQALSDKLRKELGRIMVTTPDFTGRIL